MYKFLKKVFSELGWMFNETKFGNKCWDAYERLREKELKQFDIRRKRK